MDWYCMALCGSVLLNKVFLRTFDFVLLDEHPFDVHHHTFWNTSYPVSMGPICSHLYQLSDFQINREKKIKLTFGFKNSNIKLISQLLSSSYLHWTWICTLCWYHFMFDFCPYPTWKCHNPSSLVPAFFTMTLHSLGSLWSNLILPQSAL